jgi:anaerobic glycerol-3-phosphate dehydrogenase
MVIANELNGYRNYVLPLAYHDNLVQRAVSVASAFHLLPQIPDLRAPAEAGRAAIIQRLSQTAQIANADAVLNESTWATIILLIVGDLITGHEDVITLFRMLSSFIKAGGYAKKDSALGQFLMFQSKLSAL